MPKSLPLRALFPDTRRLLLKFSFERGQTWWYLTQAATALGKTPSSLQRELQSLVDAGLLERKTEGKKVYFRVRAQSPCFQGLRNVFQAAA